MSEPLENEYFNWLCAKVLNRHAKSYYSLLKKLHNMEFVWVVPADSHRAADGIELRMDFRRETGINLEPIWNSQPCSLLELFIAFAQRAEFQTDIPVEDWFWEFMHNLHLDDYRHLSFTDHQIIDDILYVFIWRQYDPNGHGGLFPLSNTTNDQRKIEIWSQFCEYVVDRGYF